MRPRVPQIVALGGGGFTMEPNNPLLDDYVLSLASAKEPRILFLPTASGDTTAQINAFHARFADRFCVPERLSRHRLTPELLGERSPGALGGYDEDVQELRRVNRLRRGMLGEGL